MCLLVYIGSDHKIPEFKSAEISVETLSEAEQPVRQWLDMPHCRYIGSHTECGCGFRHILAGEPIEYYDGMFADEDEEVQKSMSALVELLTKNLKKGETIRIYPVWANSEGEPPIGTIRMNITEIKAEHMFFIEQFLYEIFA